MSKSKAKPGPAKVKAPAAPQPSADEAPETSSAPAAEAPGSERRSPVYVRLTADGVEYGPRGKVLALSADQAEAAIKAGEAVEASAADRAIAGV
jgi:hypothetical protein